MERSAFTYGMSTANIAAIETTPRKARRPAGDNTPTGWVAAEVRAACTRKGISQRDLGKVLSVSHATVSRRWLGDIPWDAQELIAIAVMTDTPPREFMPPLDFDPSGPLAQLVELRTFNPKSHPSLRLLTFPAPRLPVSQTARQFLRVVGESP